jgi:hypothetical protein
MSFRSELKRLLVADPSMGFKGLILRPWMVRNREFLRSLRRLLDTGLQGDNDLKNFVDTLIARCVAEDMRFFPDTNWVSEYVAVHNARRKKGSPTRRDPPLLSRERVRELWDGLDARGKAEVQRWLALQEGPGMRFALDHAKLHPMKWTAPCESVILYWAIRDYFLQTKS